MVYYVCLLVLDFQIVKKPAGSFMTLLIILMLNRNRRRLVSIVRGVLSSTHRACRLSDLRTCCSCGSRVPTLRWSLVAPCDEASPDILFIVVERHGTRIEDMLILCGDRPMIGNGIDRLGRMGLSARLPGWSIQRP